MSFCLALISIEIPGMVLVLLLGLILRYKYSLWEFLAFSFFIGLGCISFIQYILFFLGIKINSQVITIIFSLAFVLWLYLFLKFSDKIVIKRFEIGEFNWFEKLIILGLLIQALWIIFYVIPMPVQSYDSIANFSLKAKMFYLDRGIPAGFFNWSESAVAHPDYPLLVPFYMTWVYHFTGFNDILITRIMPVLYLAFLCLFYSLLVKLFPRKYSLLAVFCLGTIPQLTRYATIMYADLALGAFVACAFAYLMLYFQEKKSAFLFNSALLFGISAWIKNEALIFIAVFIIILLLDLAFSKNKIRSLGNVTLACAVIFLVAFPWLIFKFYTGTVNSDINLKVLTLSRFLKNLQDSPALLLELQLEVFNPKKWNLLWVIVITVLIWKRRLLARGVPLYTILFISLAMFLYSCALLFTTSQGLPYHAEKDMSRFMLHFCGLFIFLVLYLLKDERFGLSGYEK
jgi:4-amino-4-deoxy-L-arabinose transferase-like glycosyltransferase